MDYKESIKKKIKELMESRNIGIPTLSKLTGIPKQTLYNNLEGDVEIKISTLEKISKTLGVNNFNYWFEGEEGKMSVIDNDWGKKELIKEIKTQKTFLLKQLQEKDNMINFLKEQIKKAQRNGCKEKLSPEKETT